MKKFLIVVLVLAFLGVSGYLVYDKVLNKETPKKEEKKKEEKEEELTDKTLIDDLNKKIYFITNKNYSAWVDTDNNNKVVMNVKDYNEQILELYSFRSGKDSSFGDAFNNLNDELKLEISLDLLLSEGVYENLSDSNKNDSLISEYISTYGEQSIKQISKSKVEEKYKTTFGTDIKEHKNVGNCGGYIYSKESDVYFWVEPQCGGTVPVSVYNYKNKYSKKGDYAYVYVNYAMLEHEDNDKEGNSILYKDLEKTKSDKKINNSEEFKIDKTNYKEFSEYKYTFKKDETGNYYFVSVEKTN